MEAIANLFGETFGEMGLLGHTGLDNEPFWLVLGLFVTIACGLVIVVFLSCINSEPTHSPELDKLSDDLDIKAQDVNRCSVLSQIAELSSEGTEETISSGGSTGSIHTKPTPSPDIEPALEANPHTPPSPPDARVLEARESLLSYEDAKRAHRHSDIKRVSMEVQLGPLPPPSAGSRSTSNSVMNSKTPSSNSGSNCNSLRNSGTGHDLRKDIKAVLNPSASTSPEAETLPLSRFPMDK